MIDILIPSYNSSQTILECLNSIPLLIHNLPPHVYICDDASSDNTLELCSSINWSFPLTILVNDSNLGVGVTRQRLLNASSNPYLLFLDSDDKLSCVSSESLEKFSPTADITLLSRSIKCRQSSQTLFESSICNYQSPRSGTIEDLLECLLVTGTKFSECWGLILKRSVIQTFSLEFPENRVGEDSIFISSFLLSSGTFSYTPHFVYIKTPTYGLSQELGQGLGLSYLSNLHSLCSSNAFNLSSTKTRASYLSSKVRETSRICCIHLIAEALQKTKLTDYASEHTLSTLFSSIPSDHPTLLQYPVLVSYLELFHEAFLNLRSVKSPVVVWFASPLSYLLLDFFSCLKLEIRYLIDDNRSGTYLPLMSEIPTEIVSPLHLHAPSCRDSITHIIISDSAHTVDKVSERVSSRYPNDVAFAQIL